MTVAKNSGAHGYPAARVEVVQRLDSQAILRAAGMSNLRVDVFESLGSTNTWMLDHPVPVGQVGLCICEHQIAGRGRRGNQWQATPDRNIMCSVGWSFPVWPKSISALSLAVGMVIAEQLRRQYSLPVKVKWPNDLMVDEQKLGGILIELSGQPQNACHVVIGMGLNVDQAERKDMPTDYPWVDLQRLGVQVDRNVLVGQLVRELSAMLEGFQEHGFSRLAAHWPDYSSFQNRRIRVIEEHDETVGTMLGVDNNGGLILQEEGGGQRTFSDSSVSIRLL